MPRYKVTLITQVPLPSGRVHTEVEANNADEAKRLGHLRIAQQIGKSYPIYGASFTVDEINE